MKDLRGAADYIFRTAGATEKRNSAENGGRSQGCAGEN